MKSRVVLADDHKAFREALRNMLQRDPNIEVVGETGDGGEVLDLVQSTRPDVVVLDIRMPNVNGVAVLRELVAAHPCVRVIVASVTSVPVFAAEMIAAGASGYVTKADAEELPRAIHSVVSGARYLSAEVREAVTEPDPVAPNRRTL